MIEWIINRWNALQLFGKRPRQTRNGIDRSRREDSNVDTVTHEDRVWRFNCARADVDVENVEASGGVSWTGPVNNSARRKDTATGRAWRTVANLPTRLPTEDRSRSPNGLWFLQLSFTRLLPFFGSAMKKRKKIVWYRLYDVRGYFDDRWTWKTRLICFLERVLSSSSIDLVLSNIVALLWTLRLWNYIIMMRVYIHVFQK